MSSLPNQNSNTSVSNTQQGNLIDLTGDSEDDVPRPIPIATSAPEPSSSSSESSLSDVSLSTLQNRWSVYAKRDQVPLPYEQMPNLAERLEDAVRCRNCLQSPVSPYFQCSRAHLMCASCYQIRTQDRSLGSALGTCPVCHVRMYRQESLRNYVAEKTCAQMPVKCEQCHIEYKAGEIYQHREFSCAEMPSNCKFTPLGCAWRGPIWQQPLHESNCPVQFKKGIDVYEAALSYAERRRLEQEQYKSLRKIFERKRVVYRVMHAAPLSDDQLVENEWYQVSKFHAFDYDWSMMFKWQTDYKHADPTRQLSRICYGLRIESTANETYLMNFILVPGTFSNLKFIFEVHTFEFGKFPKVCSLLIDTPDKCKEILQKGICSRLVMAHEREHRDLLNQ